MVREYTLKLMELCDEGVLTHKAVFEEFMAYLSEDDIKEFCLNGFGGEISDLFENEEPEDEVQE